MRQRTPWRVAGLMAASLVGTGPSQAQVPPRIMQVQAAGSLRAAFEEIARAFEQERPVAVQSTFGASGLLKDRIVGGEKPDVFASANMEHPEALVAAGRASAVTPFARNALCVLASPTFSLRGKSLALRLLDADVRVGTSTPKADPSGDYAFALFDRIEATGAAGRGAADALKAKALQLTGGPGSPAPPAGRNVYGELVATGQADAFVTYCTNAASARREHAGLQVLTVPEPINVSPRYGLALLESTNPDALAYTQFLLGPKGQAILASHGFSAP
jgi:ABC-type molybdate transport system substrate-binding protein